MSVPLGRRTRVDNGPCIVRIALLVTLLMLVLNVRVILFVVRTVMCLTLLGGETVLLSRMFPWVMIVLISVLLALYSLRSIRARCILLVTERRNWATTVDFIALLLRATGETRQLIYSGWLPGRGRECRLVTNDRRLISDPFLLKLMIPRRDVRLKLGLLL